MQDVAVPRHEAWDPAFGGGARDASRTPMQWDGSSNAGFSDRRPWLPVGSDFLERNVAVQDASERSILSFYRRLAALRRDSVALQAGDWVPLVRDPESAMIYLRCVEGEAALVALNFGGDWLRIRLEETLPSRWWVPRVSTRRPDIGWSVRLSQTLELGPNEATVFTTAEGARGFRQTAREAVDPSQAKQAGLPRHRPSYREGQSNERW